MTLLYHRWYETDLAYVGGGFREVCMSWSHTDPQADETVVAVLLVAPTTVPGSTGSEEGTLYALKISLFTKTAAAAVVDSPSKGHQEEEEICSAVFEIHGPLDASVVKGTNGVVFLSTRQLLFNASGAKGGKALDRFFYSEDRTWERQYEAVNLLDAEPVCHVLTGAGDSRRPKLLLFTRISTSSPLSSVAEGDVADVLVVAYEEETNVDKGLQAKQDAKKSTISRRVVTKVREITGGAPSSASCNVHTEVLYTFVVAVLRCVMGRSHAAVAKWEVLHFFVDRRVPFQRYITEVKAQNEMWTIGGANVPDPNVPLVEPHQCSWFFLRHPCIEQRKGSDVMGRVMDGGIIVALVPQPSETPTVLCGGFDAENRSYRLGIVAGQAGRYGCGSPREVEENDNIEETLWSLAEDTHTVQMMLLGTPIEPLHRAEKGDVARNNKGAWMRETGLEMVLRFVVDFIEDGMEVVRRIGSADGGERQQGLYAAACAPLERGRCGRFPLPRAVCWLDAMPLPIGQATTSPLLFFDNGDDNCNNNNWRSAYGGMGAATVAAMGDEESTSWYHVLPTSLASTLPVRARSSRLRCFVSVNAVVKKTRLTYVLEMDHTISALASDQQQPKKMPLMLQASDLMYARPKYGQGLKGKKGGDDDDYDNDDKKSDGEDEVDAFVAYMVRAVAMRERSADVMGIHENLVAPHESLLDWASPEAVLCEVWRRVALGSHASAAKLVLDDVERGVDVAYTQPEVFLLADSIRGFLLAFLAEFDMMTHTDDDILRGVVLLMLGAIDTTRPQPYYRRQAFVNGGKSLVSLLTPSELRSIQILLKHSSLWDSLAASLFAWVNQRLPANATQATLLEEVLLAWEKKGNRVTSDSRTVVSRTALEEILLQLRASQEAFEYQNTVFALLRGNISISEISSLASWVEPPVTEPSILLLQLRLDISVLCEDAAGLFTTAAEMSRLAASVVQERLPRSSVSRAVLMKWLYEWNFGFLDGWPLSATGGALPVVYILFHLSVIDTAEAGDDGESSCGIEVEGRAQQIVSKALQVLCWLCGDSMQRSTEVMEALKAARVPLVALFLSETVATQCNLKLPASHDNNSSRVFINPLESNIGARGSGVGICCYSRALHHILMSSTVSILSDAFSNTEKECNFVDKSENKRFALKVWTLVLENDEAAAFNPNLLRQLHVAFQVRSEATPLSDIRLTPMLLLEFLRPVFLSTLPRVLSALGDQRETVGAALAVASTAAGLTSLELPVDGGENVRDVWKSTLREVKQLLRLYADESLEVQCLLLLFTSFEESCAVAPRKPGKSYDKTMDSLTGGQVVFTFSPVEMYFLALQILSNDRARYLVAAEVMRRSLRLYLLDEIHRSPPQADGVWRGSRAYLGDMMDKLELVVSAFEVTSPLHAHMLLLVFLDECASFAETAVAVANEESESVVSDIYSDILQCARRVAETKWAKLHLKERSVLSRVLSDHLPLTVRDDAEDGAYSGNEMHQQVVRDISRLEANLQQHTIDASLLRAVNETFSSELSDLVKTSPQSGTDTCNVMQELSADSADLLLLVKEEVYMRKQLQRFLLRECDQLMDDQVLRSALGVLYLALREEQRRRVFVAFALEQNDIILAFAHVIHKVMCENCKKGAHLLRQVQFERYQKRIRHLFLQERESRGAVEAVYSVELHVLFDQARQQQVLLDAEETLRHRHTEEEEMQRDALYELFAKEEIEAVERNEMRMEEEAWFKEEAQWAMVMQQQEQDERKNVERDSGEENALPVGNRPTKNVFLQWQGRKLAATKENVQGTTLEAATTTTVMKKANTGLPLQEDARAPTPVLTDKMTSPAIALAPLLLMGNTTAPNGGGGCSALLESPDSLFGAISRLHRQIVSAVVPPPSSLGSRGDVEPSASLQDQEERQEENKQRRGGAPGQGMLSAAEPGIITSSRFTAEETVQKNELSSTSLLSISLHHTSDVRSTAIDPLEVVAPCKDRSPLPRRRRQQQRRRLLGEVVILDAMPLEDSCPEPAKQQATKNSAPIGAVTTWSPKNEGTRRFCLEGNRESSGNDCQSNSKVQGCSTEVWGDMPSQTPVETPQEKTPTVELKGDAVVNVEEDRKFQPPSGLISVLEHNETATRFPIVSEERLVRAFLSRHFLLRQP